MRSAQSSKAWKQVGPLGGWERENDIYIYIYRERERIERENDKEREREGENDIYRERGNEKKTKLEREREREDTRMPYDRGRMQANAAIMILELIVFCSYRCRYRLETLSEVMYRSVLVFLCVWYSDNRQNTDTEFDGELMNCVTQIQKQILIY